MSVGAIGVNALTWGPRPRKHARMRLVSSLAEIAPAYNAILCDVWGVLHDGRRAFPEASRALARYREGGGAVALITNAPRPNAPIRAQLDRLGVAREAYDAVVTSGDVTPALIESLGGKVIYAGEPYAPIYEAAVAACAVALGPPPVRALAIGDGFRTDVAGARAQNLDVLFVAGGINRDEGLAGDQLNPAGLTTL